MSGIRAQIAMSGLVLALSAVMACGGEDDDSTTDDDNGDDDDSDGGAGGDRYTAKVVNSIMLTITIPGIKVRLFNPDDGEFYTGAGMEQTSGADGMVTFPNRPKGAGAVALSDGTSWTDTWSFQPAKKGEEEYIRMSAVGSATTVPNIAGYMNDPEASAVAGSVLWLNDDGEHEYVGCATIEMAEGVKDIRYFNNQLPTNETTRPLNLGTKPPVGDPAYPDNDGEAGRWFIANLAAGKHTITAKIGDEVIGEKDIFITARKDGSPITLDDGMSLTSNVHLGSIFVNESFKENPTPAGCK